VIWLLSPPPLFSPVSLFLSLPVCRRSSLLMGDGGWGWGRTQILRRRQSLVLYKSFNTLLLRVYLTCALLNKVPERTPCSRVHPLARAGDSPGRCSSPPLPAPAPPFPAPAPPPPAPAPPPPAPAPPLPAPCSPLWLSLPPPAPQGHVPPSGRRGEYQLLKEKMKQL
jgi:hypothetical protein